MLVENTHDDACRSTVAGIAEATPGLWHDLARQWLSARRPERHATSDEAGACVFDLDIAPA